tara:strand:- start:598 stop:1125 length:528 start_codon:yes stop_codon:yes gene_type:complete
LILLGKTLKNNSKSKGKSRVLNINLNLEGTKDTTGLIERDCAVALHDLKENSFFQPTKDKHGPYTVELYIEENKLVFHITNSKKKDLPYLVLSLKPYSRLIKDYFLIVSSYNDAINDGKPSRIEAIDMGRRGLHNEGAELLLERLKDKITLDFDTSRRLFTLICALHSGKAHIMR